MAKNLTPARVKAKDGQPISICHRYLPLLGFEEKSCLKEDLFIVPNREAFHQVIHRKPLFILICNTSIHYEIASKHSKNVFSLF